MGLFHRHKWSKWRIVGWEDTDGFEYDIQMRECETCGLTKVKHLD